MNLKGIIDRVLAVFVIWVGHIILSLVVAGFILKSLNPAVVLGINLVILFFLALKFIRYVNIRFNFLRFVSLLKFILVDPLAFVFIIITLVVIIFLTAVAYVFPIYAYDALSYHLVSVVYWMQAGRITEVPNLIWCNSYPGNAELFYLWFVIFLRSDTIVDICQLIFAVAGSIAVTGIARSIGLSYAGSVLAGCGFFLTPVVLRQSVVNYNDLMLSSMFLISLYFAFRYVNFKEQLLSGVKMFSDYSYELDYKDKLALSRGGSEISYFVLSSFSAGITLGIKFSSVLYSGVVVLLIMGHLVKEFREGLVDKKKFKFMLLSVIFILFVMGGFWFLKNLIVYGNPFYPYDFIFFKGPYRVSSIITVANIPKELLDKSMIERVLISWSREPSIYVYDQRLGGFGLQWLYVEFPMMIAFVIYTFTKRKDLFLSLVLPFIITFLLQPSNWWSRYTISVVALGAISTIFVIEKLNYKITGSIIKLAYVALTIASVYFVVNISVVIHKNIYFKLSDFVKLSELPKEERTTSKLLYQTFEMIDKLEPGSSIAFNPDEESIIYPLYGTHLKNKIVPIKAVDPDGFIDELKKSRVEYLFTRKGGKYDKWAKMMNKYFKIVDEKFGYVIYKFTS